MLTLYQQLGVSQQASEEEIKKAFRRLAMQYHPDKNSAPDANQRFVEIQLAYDVLVDPAQRAKYDDLLRYGLDLGSYSSSSYSDPTVDPITGRKNYKYHRGKPRKDRDLNEPFDNFETRKVSSFEIDYEVLTRIVFLAIPGFVFSTVSYIAFEADCPFLDVLDLVCTLPFLLFHLFIVIDCLLIPHRYYALLIKVVKDPTNRWQELFTRSTSHSVATHHFVHTKNATWYKDRMYVYESYIDFSTIQQFLVYKTPLFKIKQKVEGIVGDTIVDLGINQLKWKVLILGSCINIACLSFVLQSNMKSFGWFVVIFVIQGAYILWSIISSKLSHRQSFGDFLFWFE